MENGQDTKKKEKPIPEEELFDELDAMYQRVADIEKEEATEIPPIVEPDSSPKAGTRAAPEKPTKKKSGRNKNRSYRPMILGGIGVLLVLILGLTFWKPVAILQLLRIGERQKQTVRPRPAPRKPSAVVSPKTVPGPSTASPSTAALPPPSAVAPPASSTPPATVASPAPSKPPSEPVAVKSPPEGVEKARPLPQEEPKPDKPSPRGKFFAVQIGSFREMENVRGLVEALKKEGLDAYWITSKSQKRGTLYKVFVGQFMDTSEAARFLKDNKSLKNYPGSFVQEVSSSSR